MHRARARGVVDDATKAKKIAKSLKDEMLLREWIEEFLDTELSSAAFLQTDEEADSSIPPKEPPPKIFPPLPKAPCVFELLKWKADELVVDGLRWRDIVSFAGHPLQAWSRVMSRCLQMLVSFLIDQGIGLGFAKMQGVRDQLQVAARMGCLPHETEFKEEDMADMFWEIPATDVQLAVQWALNTVRAKQRAANLCFSVSKESNHLDRIGRSTTPGFTFVREECASRFVDFVLDNNSLQGL